MNVNDILLLGLKAGLAIMAMSWIIAVHAGAVYGDRNDDSSN